MFTGQTVGDAYHSQELQDFYLSTEKYSPPVRPTSSLSKGSPREGVTPAQSLNDVMVDDPAVAREIVSDEAAENIHDRYYRYLKSSL